MLPCLGEEQFLVTGQIRNATRATFLCVKSGTQDKSLQCFPSGFNTLWLQILLTPNSHFLHTSEIPDPNDATDFCDKHHDALTASLATAWSGNEK